jgi:acetate kinase
MAGGTREILVLNAGSSSLKLGLFDWETDEQLADKGVDWSHGNEAGVSTHSAALRHLLEEYDLGPVAAVGHRVVHGGTRYRQAVRIDADVKAAIAELARLAPLHNPAALQGIEAVEDLLPGVPQVAAFDTAFHSTMPPTGYLYAVPWQWTEEWGIRRFGFHGLSHAYCSGRALEMLQRPAPGSRIVTCHLGNGCSLAAVQDGRSVATTMGFTPLEGLMMGTRSGSVDPGLLIHLLAHNYVDVPGLDQALNHESGLKGVSGLSGDMREIQAAVGRGDARAQQAFALYNARIREGIAAMVAAMNGVDALVFTAGVGEHSAEVRGAVAGALGWMGVALDEAANAAAHPDTDIATADSRVRLLVIHTREELVVARDTRRVLQAGPATKEP